MNGDSVFTQILSHLYRRLVLVKNFVYDAGFADSIKVGVPVVSVGNLTVGGTGKTPVIDWLVSELEARQKRVAIVSRNYKAKSKGTHQVDLRRPDGALFYGDEPFWLSVQHPNAKVIVGPSKWLSASEAVRGNSVDILFVDDGFQHRALHRDLDIVLLDATKNFDEYKLLPVGRARDPWDSLLRANMVVLTKSNLVTEEKLNEIKSRIPPDLPTYVVDYEVSFPSQNLEGGRFFAFSGLADDHAFEKSLESFKIAEHMKFNDHHRYTKKDIEKIEGRARHVGCDKILTTAKDYVKIKNLPHKSELFEVIGLKLKWRQTPKCFYDFLDKTFRH